MFIDSPMSCNDATFTVEIPPGSSHPPSAVGPLGIVHDPRRMHYRQLVPWRPVIRVIEHVHDGCGSGFETVARGTATLSPGAFAGRTSTSMDVSSQDVSPVVVGADSSNCAREAANLATAHPAGSVR